MDIPATMAAESAITKQNMLLSSIKHNADQAQMMANILEQSTISAPISDTKGTNVNFTA